MEFRPAKGQKKREELKGSLWGVVKNLKQKVLINQEKNLCSVWSYGGTAKAPLTRLKLEETKG